MMDRTKPPPGFDPYCDGYMLTEAMQRVHYASGFDEYTLTEAWEYYDRITLPARVALLRELVEELTGDPLVGYVYDHMPTDVTRQLYSSPLAVLAKVLRERADKLAGQTAEPTPDR